MLEKKCKPRNINVHKEVTDNELNLIGAIIRQAVVDYCAPPGNATVEKDRITADWFLSHSPLMLASGLDKDYLVAAYKRGSLYYKKAKDEED